MREDALRFEGVPREAASLEDMLLDDISLEVPSFEVAFLDEALLTETLFEVALLVEVFLEEPPLDVALLDDGRDEAPVRLDAPERELRASVPRASRELCVRRVATDCIRSYFVRCFNAVTS